MTQKRPTETRRRMQLLCRNAAEYVRLDGPFATPFATEWNANKWDCATDKNVLLLMPAPCVYEPRDDAPAIDRVMDSVRVSRSVVIEGDEIERFHDWSFCVERSLGKLHGAKSVFDRRLIWKLLCATPREPITIGFPEVPLDPIRFDGNSGWIALVMPVRWSSERDKPEVFRLRGRPAP